MKRTGMCPKCSGRDLLELAGVTEQIGSAPVGLEQDTWVCAACGYIEFYAHDVQALLAQGKLSGRGGGPFR